MSVVRCPWSVVRCQLPIATRQLSLVRCHLPVINFQFLVMGFWLMVRDGDVAGNWQRTTDNGLQIAKKRYRMISTSATPSATVRAYFGLFILLTSGIKSDAAT